ncbi:MAG: UDP-N-acetylmuramoyl-tripeptide--D-alanyl-D-alanine ligase [Deltaproteobacteria bacterium]|nr:UDP-N-acetylmuramoyl-tripeptide--D-alanyl-D-alanine ligase [Deltaproteobacteria bacterium]
MIQETLQWAAEAMGGSFHGSHPDAEFRGVCTDTRALKPGEIFICLVGERDGHNFAAQAVDAGAACVVADELHRASIESLPARAQAILVKDTLRALGELARAWRRRFAVPVVAVAGSNGKTTTKELTKAVLETRLQILATDGNFNNQIGVPKTLFRLETGHQAAVVEVGMNDFGELARLTEIVEPTAGLVTNIGLEHLEKLGDLDGVQRAEGELFAGLAPEATALVNRLDERVAALPTRAKKIFYGKPGDPVWGEVLEGAADVERPLRLRVNVDGETAELALRIPGPHHLSNVLAALAVGRLLNIPLAAAKRGLEALAPAPSRGQVLELKSGRRVIDDCYNANPSSTVAALHALARLKGEAQSLAILGDMLELGEATRAGHRMVGESAAREKTDWLVAVGPHADEILRGARAQGMPAQRLRSFPDTDDAIAALSDVAPEVRWILVKGSRGMRLEKIVSYLKERY